MTQATDITDLVNGTLSKYGRNFITDAMSTLQNYTAAERLMNKKRLTFDSGTDYKFNILTTADGNARAIGFFEVDDLDQVDGSAQGTIPWRFLETGCHYDVKQLSVNDGPERIFNFVKEKEYQMWQGFYDLVEQYFWDGPASDSDTKVPFGLLNYWLDYSASTGFNGGNHANWSSGPAGLSISTYSRWSHYTARYDAVSDADLVRTMRKAFALTNFKGIPNKPIKGYDDGVGHNFGIYTTYDTLYQLEELLGTKNDNVKNELAKYDGMTVFRRTPVEYVAYLEKNHATSDPVIMLDWSDIKCAALRKEWMRQTPYQVASNQHDVRQRFVNCSMNFAMHNRRKHTLIAKSDPLSD